MAKASSPRQKKPAPPVSTVTLERLIKDAAGHGMASSISADGKITIKHSREILSGFGAVSLSGFDVLIRNRELYHEVLQLSESPAALALVKKLAATPIGYDVPGIFTRTSDWLLRFNDPRNIPATATHWKVSPGLWMQLPDDWKTRDPNPAPPNGITLRGLITEL